MKKILYIFGFILFITKPSAQNVAINNDGSVANTSAILDIKSINKGLLIPRMTSAQRAVINTPAIGLIVFDTDTQSLWYYTATGWTNMTSISPGSGTNWKLSGNINTNPLLDFIGTIDNQSLRFKVNDQHYGLLDKNGTILWGFEAGLINTAYNNIAIGSRALFSNTYHLDNIAIGDSSLFSNGTGASVNQARNNLAIGYKSLFSNSTGSSNVAIGKNTLMNNTTGVDNLAIGVDAMNYNTTGSYNTALGTRALHHLSIGNQNVGIGMNTLFETTSGSNNVALGMQALVYNSTGNENVAIGSGALIINTTGSRNTAIGTNAGVSVNSLTNATAIGYNSLVNASNKIAIGNSSVISIGGYANWSNFSDGRFKRNVKEDVPGIEFIKKLRPVTYSLDIDAINEFNSKESPAGWKIKTTNSEKKTEIYSGFVAQEVEQAAKSIGYDFSGVDKPKDNTKQTYALRYSDFVMPMVKAIQEQQKMIEELQKQIEELKKQIQK